MKNNNIVVTAEMQFESLNRVKDSEIVIGLVGAVGARIDKAKELIRDRLSAYNYKSEIIKISEDVIPLIQNKSINWDTEYERIDRLMTAGNVSRKNSCDNSILAKGAVSLIAGDREEEERQIDEVKYKQAIPKKRTAYIIDSLKHQREIEVLRDIYSEGFYLIGVYSSKISRLSYLTRNSQMHENLAEKLIGRDDDEHLDYGQQTRNVFYLSDFFVHIDEQQNEKNYKDNLNRFLDIIFGNPFETPTIDEFAMFMAFASSLQSSDLARQVGAVILNTNDEIIATGFNDSPKYGGGLYKTKYCDIENSFIECHRDHEKGFDSNTREIEDLANEISTLIFQLGNNNITKSEIHEAILEKTSLKNITEYGRSVHAELEALLHCARNGINLRESTLYCTTFPCHNCAKHIINSGINKVIYIEPYPKSKALDLHSDEICEGIGCSFEKIIFQPFMGVGPRKYFNLFSTKLSSGYPIERKKRDGSIVDWNKEVRLQMLPRSYIGREEIAANHFEKVRKEINYGLK